jgi:hypothetical protein
MQTMTETEPMTETEMLTHALECESLAQSHACGDLFDVQMEEVEEILHQIARNYHFTGATPDVSTDDVWLEAMRVCDAAEESMHQAANGVWLELGEVMREAL